MKLKKNEKHIINNEKIIKNFSLMMDESLMRFKSANNKSAFYTRIYNEYKLKFN